MARLPVCSIAELPATGALLRRLADGTEIAIVRISGAGDRVAAFENRCPHAEYPMARGKITGTTIVCPWHFLPFDIVTGDPVEWEGKLRLRVFRATVEDGQVVVEVDGGATAA